jgi:hypothetical protein
MMLLKVLMRVIESCDFNLIRQIGKSLVFVAL